MKTKLIPRLVRAIPALGVSILLLGQSAFADILGNWTTNQVSTNRFGLDSVVYGNGCYVAAGTFSDYGAIISSEDGLNWTVRADGGFPNPNGAPIWGLKVSFANNRFIGVSAWGGTVISTNGTNWTLGYAPLLSGGANDLYLTGATYGGGNYVAVGFGEFATTVSNIITSTDGVTWTYRRSHLTEGRSITDVAYGAGVYVAIGANDGFTYTSASASSWTRRSILGGSAIAFCNGIFIVPYGPGTNLISTNGINWAPVNTGISNQMGKVIFANGLFISRAGSPYTGLGPYLATSTDGTNWVQYPQLLPGQGLATDGRRLVTVGELLVFQPLYYNGFVYQSDPLVDIRMTNAPSPKIALSGLVGCSYRIEFTDAFAASGINNWQPLTTLQLPLSPYLFTDTTATNAQRFYRGVLLP